MESDEKGVVESDEKEGVESEEKEVVGSDEKEGGESDEKEVVRSDKKRGTGRLWERSGEKKGGKVIRK